MPRNHPSKRGKASPHRNSEFRYSVIFLLTQLLTQAQVCPHPVTLLLLTFTISAKHFLLSPLFFLSLLPSIPFFFKIHHTQPQYLPQALPISLFALEIPVLVLFLPMGILNNSEVWIIQLIRFIWVSWLHSLLFYLVIPLLGFICLPGSASEPLAKYPWSWIRPWAKFWMKAIS